MDDSRARWTQRKFYDCDIYYDRSTRTVFRRLASAKIGANEEVSSSPFFNPVAPLKVYFDPSYRCNLSCSHCITNSSPLQGGKNELPPKRIVAILDELSTIGVLEISVGGGEPLCYPDLFTILDHARTIGLNVVLNTNGTLVTPEVASHLKELDLSEVRVSFEGWQGIHDSIRGQGAYERALEAVAILSRTGVVTVPRVTLCQGSEAGLERFFHDLALATVKVIKCSTVKDAGRASLAGHQGLLFSNTVTTVIANLRELGKKYGIQVKLPSYFSNSPEEADGGELRFNKGMNCGAGVETGYVSPCGNVHPCSSLPNITLGTLATMSFKDVWTGPVATHFRRLAFNCSCHQLCTKMKLIDTAVLSGVTRINVRA